MSHSPKGAERRQFGRRQTALHAWIKVAGRPPLPCMVRDLSVGGALIELVAPSWLPYQFKLVIEATRFEATCEIRHQRQGHIGVMFLVDQAGRSVEPVSSNAGGERAAWDSTVRPGQ